MDPLERNQLFDALFRAIAKPRNPYDPDSPEAVSRHNRNKEIIRLLWEDGYCFQCEYLYDALGHKVAQRVGTVRRTGRRGRYHFVEERFYEDGQPINRDQAMRYWTRGGGIIEAW